MNDYQTLFSIVFGIYFATTVSASGRFALFDTTAIASGDQRALWRLLLSFAMLDILPFFYFIWVLDLLAPISAKLTGAWSSALGVLMVGLGGFGIYRLLLAVVLLRRPGDALNFLFYSLPAELSNARAAAGARLKQPPDDAVPYSPLAVAFGGLLWFAVCFGAFWWLTLRHWHIAA